MAFAVNCRAYERFQMGVVSNELITVYNLTRKFLPHRLQYTAINNMYAMKTPYSTMEPFIMTFIFPSSFMILIWIPYQYIYYPL